MAGIWRYRGNGGGRSDGEYIFGRPRSRQESSYHTKKIHTLSFPTFGLTRSIRDMVDLRNSVGSTTPGSSVSNGPGFELEKRFGSVPEPSKNRTRCFLAVQTQPRTRQLTGFAGFGWTRRVQSPALHFGLFYLWLHSDILRLIIEY